MIKKFMDSKAPGRLLLIFSVFIFAVSVANIFIFNDSIQDLIWILLFIHLSLLVCKELYDYIKLSREYMNSIDLNLRILSDTFEFYDYVYNLDFDENIKSDIAKKFNEIINNRCNEMDVNNGKI